MSKEKREIDKLKDKVKYKATCIMMGFCIKGQKFTGKQIKQNIPFDVSPRQGWKTFFKEVK